jgi:hypothetical protein
LAKERPALGRCLDIDRLLPGIFQKSLGLRPTESDAMAKQVWVTDVPRPSGGDILVVKLPDGGASSRWLAQRVVNAVRSKIPLSEMDRDVVVLNGGADQPLVIGTSAAAEQYLSALLSQIDDYPWRAMQLTW